MQDPKYLDLTALHPQHLANLCGTLDTNLRLIEEQLSVKITHHGESFTLSGANTSQVTQLLPLLHKQAQHRPIKSNEVQVAIKNSLLENAPIKPIFIKTPKKSIEVRSHNQQQYIQSITDSDCSFGIGPAGTGKTFLAVAKAVEALEKSLIDRIILVRPAVEAGEKLGFLPGDLSDKVDPYLRPIYDALYLMLGAKRTEKLLEQNIIEVAPLAFMRGRTLNDVFVILDEAQNTTIEQMKMFLTRLGFNSTMVITGDISQIDLPKHIQSGLNHAIKVLENEADIDFNYLSVQDIMRHRLVNRIVMAYDRHPSV